MRQRLRSHLTYSNVVSTLCLFLVLGGGAYAAFHLPKNSVRSKNIVNGQVRSPDLARGLKKPTFHSAGLPDDTNFDCSSVPPDHWANQDSSTVGFYRDLAGRVYLRGIIKRCGDPSEDMLTLPAGFRPEQSEESLIPKLNQSGSPVVLGISSNGVANPSSVGTNDVFSLSGVSFRCGPSGEHGCP